VLSRSVRSGIPGREDGSGIDRLSILQVDHPRIQMPKVKSQATGQKKTRRG
jgi:hypothetical protein